MKKDSSYSCIGSRSRGAVWAALALSAGLVMTPTVVFADELGGSLSDPTVVTAASGQAQDSAGLDSGNKIGVASGTDVASVNMTPTQQTGAGRPEETKQSSQDQNLFSASSEKGASEGVEQEASSEDLQNAQPLSSENARTSDSSSAEPAQPTNGKDGTASNVNAVVSAGLSDASGQESASTPAASEVTTAGQSAESVVSASTEEQGSIYVSAQGDDSADGKSVDTAYRTLQQAINACPDGGTVYIVGTYQTPDKQDVSITKSMTLAGYEQNGAKAELHEGKGVQYYLLIGNNINVTIKDLVIDGENPDDRPGMGHGRLIMLTLVRGVTHRTTLTLDHAEVRNYIGHEMIDTDNGNNENWLIIKDSLIHGFKGSYRSRSSAIMMFSYIEATNSKFYDCNGSYVWPVAGGAIRISEGGTGVFTNCEFYNNSQHLGGAIYNAGNATINGGSITDNDARSNGGGVYNRDGSAVMTLNGVTIYNNTAGDSGDDIFNRTGGTITFEAVGKDWELDGHPCNDTIKAWYDDSEGSRWNAHDVDKVHVIKVDPGTYKGDALALKAAHDTGAYRILYRTQNDDRTYSSPVQDGGIVLYPISSNAVSVDHKELDEKLAKQGYRLVDVEYGLGATEDEKSATQLSPAASSPSELVINKVFNGDINDCYTVLLTYDATGAYRVMYRTQNADGTYSDPVEYGDLVYCPLGKNAVAIDHAALDAELDGKGYSFSRQEPGELVVSRRYCGNAEDAYTVVLDYDVKPKPVEPNNEKPSPTNPEPAEPAVPEPPAVPDAATGSSSPRHMADTASQNGPATSPRHMAAVPSTGDETSPAAPAAAGEIGLGIAALGALLRRRRED